MFHFKKGTGVPESAEQREELVDGLQYRIHKERAMLKRRLIQEEPEARDRRPARSRRSGKTHRTGKLYQVFQALTYEDED